MNPLVFSDTKLSRLQTTAIGMAVVGLVLCVIGFATDPSRLWQSYLFGYIFWVGATLGSLGLLLLHQMVSGGWGFLIRRQLEAATRLLPLMFVLFLPIAFFGMHSLYPWSLPGATSHGVLAQKAAWLNWPAFMARTVIYFIIWGVWAYFLNKWGNTQDERSDERIVHRLNVFSAPGMILLILTVTAAAVDWVMSLTPEWYSSIIGLLFGASFALNAMSLNLVLFAFLNGDLPTVDEVPKKYFRDLGNLLLALVMLWAYMSFSQYLITYSGNTAEEATWYMSRKVGGWGWISLGLIPFHFALPFLVLLVGSGLKKDPRRLARIAAFLIFMRLVDVFWWIAPTFRDHVSVSLSDIGAPLLIGGIWLWLFAMQLKDRRIIPVHDPRLEGHWPVGEVAHHG